MISKDERKSIGISAVASIIGMCAVILPVGWYFVKPALAASISTVMAEDIEEKIDRKLMPLNAGFKAILQQNIEQIQRNIARLEYRQSQDPNWSVQEASDLAQMRIDLSNQRAALTAIRDAEG